MNREEPADTERALGGFTVGESGIVVADQVYNPLQPALSVAIADAAPGVWYASVSHDASNRTAPHRSLVALHADVAKHEPSIVWEEVEWDLCCDSCDVVVSDAQFRAEFGSTLRAMGSGDALVVFEDHAGGAKATCCYDPWRCEVAVYKHHAQTMGVRVRWYSGTCEVFKCEYVLDGIIHWLNVEEGCISVISEQSWNLERSFSDFHWSEFGAAMEELKIPKEYHPAIRDILVRHGAVSQASHT